MGGEVVPAASPEPCQGKAPPQPLALIPHQVPPHRLLFCSTAEGKVAIVRQLEPELHIDGSHNTVDDLK